MVAVDSKYYIIEQKRRELMSLAETLGYTSPDTVKASQELDQLMNMLFLDKQDFTFHQVK